jgi:hypothetical protein
MNQQMNSGDEICVTYDASDFRALYRACRRCKRGALFLLILTPLFFGSLDYFGGNNEVPLIYDVLPYLLIVLAILALSYFLLPWNAVRVRRQNGWAEPMAIRLADDGIVTRHPNQDTFFYWAKIRQIIVRGNRLFLFTSPACAVILPRRSFVSDEQFADWTERAQRLWNNCRSEAGK